MKRKGFTLIELLAVIVILAVIAIIATPIIVGIIEDSKKSAFERSVEGIMNAIDLEFGTQESLTNFTYEIENGEVKNTTLKTPIKNLEGFNGIIKYDEKGNSTYAVNDGIWCAIKTSSGDVTTSEYLDGLCSLPFENGEIVYYDVLTGKTCTNYHEDNSLTGYNGVTTTTENQTSCLKFYAFNDKESNASVSLLLDHNTTAQVVWNSSGSYTTGPEDAILQLKTDTDSWVGTITPANYTVEQDNINSNLGSGYSNSSYIIDYSEYKARLITAQEVAEITGNESFNENTSNYNSSFYFDTNTSRQASDCKYGNTSGCKYGWLYDRTDTSCEYRGCLNNSDAKTEGYWTSTTAYSRAYFVWFVSKDSYMTYTYFSGHSSGCPGVRPVIEVLKSNL